MRTKLVLGFTLALLPTLLSMALEASFGWQLAALLATLLIGTGVVHVLTRPILQAVKQAKGIIDKPLMQDIYTGRRDEAGTLQLAFKFLQQETIGMVGRIADSTSRLHEMSGNVTCAMQQSTGAVEQQSAETEQIATAMNELNASSEEVAKSASPVSTSRCMPSMI